MVCVLNQEGRWIIPARAGFTENLFRRSYALPDHPRSRGVYMFVTFG